MALLAYAKDQNKDGRKRFKVLGVLFRHLPEEEQIRGWREAFIGDADPGFRVLSAIQMGRMRDETNRQVLMKSLTDSEEPSSVQIGAALGLAWMGDASGKERALRSVLEAETWCDFGMRALVKLNAQDVVPTLQAKLVSTKDYWERNKIRLAILRLDLVGKEEDQQVRLLKEALREDGFYHVRKWVGRKLGNKGTESARQALIEVARDETVPGQWNGVIGLLTGAKEGFWAREDVKRWLSE